MQKRKICLLKGEKFLYFVIGILASGNLLGPAFSTGMLSRTNTEVESWIIGVVKRRDVYSFRSRKSYSQDTIVNLKNIGFFEQFRFCTIF